MSAETTPTITVVIPTYHRPDSLARAVTSVVGQELAPGQSFEVVIAVSDANRAPDIDAARALAGGRVRFVVADRLGPGAARNAGLAAARAPLVAFMDDDCVAEPGWLAAGVAALEDADLAQGMTRPAGAVGGYDHSLSVTPLSGLWESCNLFVRVAVPRRLGSFDEDWNPTGRVGGHMGEDVEWGWRMVRGGARPAAAPGALVLHDVVPRSYREYLRYQAQLRFFPALFRVAPESRRVFYRGVFVNRRHVTLSAAAALLTGALVAAASGKRGGAVALAATGAAVYLAPLRAVARDGAVGPHTRTLVSRIPVELLELGVCVYGSARWRRLLL